MTQLICDPKPNLCNHCKNPYLNIYTNYKKYMSVGLSRHQGNSHSDIWRNDTKYRTIRFKVNNNEGQIPRNGISIRWLKRKCLIGREILTEIMIFI